MKPNINRQNTKDTINIIFILLIVLFIIYIIYKLGWATHVAFLLSLLNLGVIFFFRYAILNNNHNVSQLKKRIEQLETLLGVTPTIENEENRQEVSSSNSDVPTTESIIEQSVETIEEKAISLPINLYKTQQIIYASNPLLASQDTKFILNQHFYQIEINQSLNNGYFSLLEESRTQLKAIKCHESFLSYDYCERENSIDVEKHKKIITTEKGIIQKINNEWIIIKKTKIKFV